MGILIVYGVIACVVGFCKAVADTCSHSDIWHDSRLSNWFSETSFWGPKDKTWIRKDRPDKPILDWLLHFPLVMFTDAWHLMNSVAILHTMALLVFPTDIVWYHELILFYIPFNLTFNLFYHGILKK